MTIDRSAILNLKSLEDPELLETLFKIYFEEAPRQIAAIRKAAGEGDARSLQSQAHSLKSSSANLGATAVSALCLELETLGGNGSTEGAFPLVSRLEQEYAAAKAELEKEL